MISSCYLVKCMHPLGWMHCSICQCTKILFSYDEKWLIAKNMLCTFWHSGSLDWLHQGWDLWCNIQLHNSFFKSKDSFMNQVLDCIICRRNSRILVTLVNFVLTKCYKDKEEPISNSSQNQPVECLIEKVDGLGFDVESGSCCTITVHVPLSCKIFFIVIKRARLAGGVQFYSWCHIQ